MRSVLLTLCFALAAGAACSPGGSNAGPDATTTSRSTAELDPVRDAAAYASAHASPEQMDALHDSVVSAAEYEAAVLATVACMTENGVQMVDRPHWDQATQSRIRFSFIGGPTMEASRKTNEVYDSCRLKFSAAIEQLWIIQDQPSEQKLQQARAALETCLRAAGIDVPEGATSPELGKFVSSEAFWPCAKEIERDFQLPGFAG